MKHSNQVRELVLSDQGIALADVPAAIFLDEAWLMLSHPVFRDKIKKNPDFGLESLNWLEFGPGPGGNGQTVKK